MWSCHSPGAQLILPKSFRLGQFVRVFQAKMVISHLDRLCGGKLCLFSTTFSMFDSHKNCALCSACCELPPLPHSQQHSCESPHTLLLTKPSTLCKSIELSWYPIPTHMWWFYDESDTLTELDEQHATGTKRMKEKTNNKTASAKKLKTVSTEKPKKLQKNMTRDADNP